MKPKPKPGKVFTPSNLVLSENVIGLHALAAEEAILGGILLDSNAITRIEHLLKPEHFYLESHRKIYSASLAVYRERQAADLISISAKLRDLGELKDIGGELKLMQLLDNTVHAVNIDQHAGLVIEKAKRRSLIACSAEIAKLANDTSCPLREVLDGAEEAVFAVTSSAQNHAPVPIGEPAWRFYDEVEHRSVSNEPPGYATGFYDLDNLTKGFQPGDLIVLAARPSMGKTAMMLAVACNIAQQHTLPVLLFSLEMSADQLAARLVSTEARLEAGRLKTGNIGDGEWSGFGKATSAIADLPILIHDRSSITVGDIRSHSRQVAAERGKLACIAIDYLQLMEGGGDKTENRVQELSRITRSLKGLARELNVPVIALSQLSRGVESRTNKRPMMSDLRESGAIEQDADLILMLYRDEYYDPDSPDKGIAELIVTKHRNGPTGTVKLLFQAEYARFLNRASIS